jgi:hypothetical protein
MRSTRIPAFYITLLAFTLVACGTPPRLQIAETDRFSLSFGPSAQQTTLVVKDLRPDEQKLPARFGGWLQLGDLALEPSPSHALASALQEHASSRSSSNGVRAAIAKGPIELRHFQVLAQNRDVESRFRGLENQTIPGVLILDGLMTSLQKATVGSSKMRVVISFDVGEVRFSSDEFSVFSAAPGANAPAQVLEQALQPIYRRLEIAFGPR